MSIEQAVRLLTPRNELFVTVAGSRAVVTKERRPGDYYIGTVLRYVGQTGYYRLTVCQDGHLVIDPIGVPNQSAVVVWSHQIVVQNQL